MTVRVGVNGFGRIGRNFLRAVLAGQADVEVVAINDLTSAATNAHLLRYDSTHGRLPVPVVVDGDDLVVDGRRIRVLAEREPALLPWGDLGVEVVLESTGIFTSRADAAVHLKGGASRVVISAPSGDADATFVVGVNDDDFDPEAHVVVSNASCTTNCFVPMVKVLDDAFGVVSGLMTTVHAYTNDQNLLDLPHKDLRRARAAAVNIVPASTGAARATGVVLAAMQGRLDGTALRVPVADGSLTDFTAVLGAPVTVEEVNRAFAAAAASPPLGPVLDYTEDPIVSSDIVGSPASCTFDAGLTMVQPIDERTTLVKVQGWYDNEWGYANRLVDLVAIVGGAADPGTPA
jgi:glyceraldehyde 3-phosphate dehydrogenase